MKKAILLALAVMLAVFTGCSAGESTPSEDVQVRSHSETSAYEQITQDEARRIMSEEEDIIILDVRTQEEFDEGHIPGAVCLPNETIGTVSPEILPDKQQTILVYCRSGRRSKEASEKLAALGYTAGKEFGGIIDWTGDTEK